MTLVPDARIDNGVKVNDSDELRARDEDWRKYIDAPDTEAVVEYLDDLAPLPWSKLNSDYGRGRDVNPGHHGPEIEAVAAAVDKIEGWGGRSR